MDALGQVAHPQYTALIIRRSFPELRDLIRRSQVLYPVVYRGARYNKTERVWEFPNGAIIEFGYLENYDDVFRYQGREFTYLALDEATHYDEEAYLYLLSRVRATAPDLRCYVRLTGNPGGKGHHWVKARYVDPAPAETPIVETFLDPISGEPRTRTRIFIPSRLKDNPHLARTSYGITLQMLSEADRKALLEGDWNAYSGTVFDLKRGIHVWSWAQFAERVGGGKPEIPENWHVFRSMDWGYAAPYAVYWYAVDPDGRMYAFRELYGVAKDSKGQILTNTGVKQPPQVVARKIKEIDTDLGCQHGVADPAIWAKGKGDFGGGPSIAEQMLAEDVTWTAGKNDRLQGKMQLHYRLHYKPGEWPMLIFIEEECPHAIRTLPALEYDKHRVEDVETDGDDHGYDSIRYACMSRPLTPRVETWQDKYNRIKEERDGDGWT